jgi:hypothetical protein
VGVLGWLVYRLDYSLGGAGKRHSLGAGIFNHATAASGDQLSDLALTTRAAIRGDRSAAVTRLIFR